MSLPSLIPYLGNKRKLLPLIARTGHLTTHLCPADDAAPDPNQERL